MSKAFGLQKACYLCLWSRISRSFENILSSDIAHCCHYTCNVNVIHSRVRRRRRTVFREYLSITEPSLCAVGSTFSSFHGCLHVLSGLPSPLPRKVLLRFLRCCSACWSRASGAFKRTLGTRDCHGFCYGFLWGMGMGIDFCTPTKPIPQPWVWWVGSTW
jgi:hypothetical protein